MEIYLKTKNYMINKKDIISLDEYGDKIRIRYYDWLKSDKKNRFYFPIQTKYPTTIFVYKKDLEIKEIQ